MAHRDYELDEDIRNGFRGRFITTMKAKRKRGRGQQGNIEGLAKHMANKYGGDPGFFTAVLNDPELLEQYPRHGWTERHRREIAARVHKIVTGIWPGEHGGKNPDGKEPAKKKELTTKGGKGSGNFFHAGRPGKVGGSTARPRGAVDKYERYRNFQGHNALSLAMIFVEESKNVDDLLQRAHEITAYRRKPWEEAKAHVSEARLNAMRDSYEKYRGAKTEHGLAFDESGNLMFEKSGNEDSVRFTDEDLKQIRAAGLLWHNHPKDMNGLSLQDIAMASTNNCAIAVFYTSPASGKTTCDYFRGTPPEGWGWAALNFNALNSDLHSSISHMAQKEFNSIPDSVSSKKLNLLRQEISAKASYAYATLVTHFASPVFGREYYSFELPEESVETTKGGEGSGNFGHAGRPGKVGGSSPKKGGISAGVFDPRTATPADAVFMAGTFIDESDTSEDLARRAYELVRDRRYKTAEEARKIIGEARLKTMREFFEKRKGADVEHAIAIDESGKIMFEKGGDEKTVVFTLPEMEKIAGAGLLMHNHPNNESGLSGADIIVGHETGTDIAVFYYDKMTKKLRLDYFSPRLRSSPLTHEAAATLNYSLLEKVAHKKIQDLLIKDYSSFQSQGKGDDATKKRLYRNGSYAFSQIFSHFSSPAVGDGHFTFEEEVIK